MSPRSVPLARRAVAQRWPLLILALGAVAGLTLLLGAPRPGSLDQLLPDWLVTAWAAMLAFGCVAGLAGRLSGRPLVTRFGMTLLAPAAFAYVVAIFGVAGWRALAAGWAVLAFGACAVGDVVEISLAVRHGQRAGSHGSNRRGRQGGEDDRGP